MKKRNLLFIILSALSLLAALSFSACRKGDEVIHPTSVTLSRIDAAMRVGESLTLTYTISPENATNQSVMWVSSNPDVATVDGGKVTAVGAGDTTITLEVLDGHLLSQCQISVTDRVDVSGVDLSQSQVELTVGESYTLLPTVQPSNATNQAVSWASSAPEIVSVVDGKLIAVAVGSAQISVTTQDGGLSATCSVTVKSVPVTGVSIPATLDIGTEHTAMLSATVLPANATNKKVSWSSLSPDIADVDGGTVVGIKEGSATIRATAEDGGVYSECVVTVHSYRIQVVDQHGDAVSGAKLQILGVGVMTSASDGFFTSLDGDSKVSIRASSPDSALFVYDITKNSTVAYYFLGENGMAVLNDEGVKDYVYILTVQKYQIASGAWLTTDNERAPTYVDSAGVYATEIIAVDDPNMSGQKTSSVTYVKIAAPVSEGKKFTVRLMSEYILSSDGVNDDAYVLRANASKVNKYLVTIVLGGTFDLYLHPEESMILEISAPLTKDSRGEYIPYSFVIDIAEGILPKEGTTPDYPYVAKLGKAIGAERVNVGENKNEDGETYFVLDVSEQTTIPAGGGVGKVQLNYMSGSLSWKINTGAEAGFSLLPDGSTVELFGGNFALFCMKGAAGNSTFTIKRVYALGEYELPYEIDLSAGNYADVKDITNQVGQYRYVKVSASNEQTTFTVSMYAVPKTDSSVLAPVMDYFTVVYIQDDNEVEICGETQSTGVVTVPAGKTWYIKVYGMTSSARVIVQA